MKKPIIMSVCLITIFIVSILNWNKIESRYELYQAKKLEKQLLDLADKTFGSFYRKTEHGNKIPIRDEKLLRVFKLKAIKKYIVGKALEDKPEIARKAHEETKQRSKYLAILSQNANGQEVSLMTLPDLSYDCHLTVGTKSFHLKNSKKSVCLQDFEMFHQWDPNKEIKAEIVPYQEDQYSELKSNFDLRYQRITERIAIKYFLENLNEA